MSNFDYCNDRKRKSSESAENLLEKNVKSCQMDLFLAGFSCLKPMCVWMQRRSRRLSGAKLLVGNNIWILIKSLGLICEKFVFCLSCIIGRLESWNKLEVFARWNLAHNFSWNFAIKTGHGQKNCSLNFRYGQKSFDPVTSHWRHQRPDLFNFALKTTVKVIKIAPRQVGHILVDARLNVDQVAYLKSQKNKINWTVFTWNQSEVKWFLPIFW